jgi:hypothetical protein
MSERQLTIPRTVIAVIALLIGLCVWTVTRAQAVNCDEKTEGLRLSHTDGVILGREFRGRLIFRNEMGGSAKARPSKLIPCRDVSCKEKNQRHPILELGRGGHFKVKRNINTAKSKFCRSGQIEEHRYVEEPIYLVSARGCGPKIIVLDKNWTWNGVKRIELNCDDAG